MKRSGTHALVGSKTGEILYASETQRHRESGRTDREGAQNGWPTAEPESPERTWAIQASLFGGFPGWPFRQVCSWGEAWR